jgi:hypothetical protein
MSYERPPYDQADVTWQGDSEYTPLTFDNADAQFLPPFPTARAALLAPEGPITATGSTQVFLWADLLSPEGLITGDMFTGPGGRLLLTLPLTADIYADFEAHGAIDAIRASLPVRFDYAVIPTEFAQVIASTRTFQQIPLTYSDLVQPLLTSQANYVLQMADTITATDPVTFVQALALLDHARAADTPQTVAAAQLVLALVAHGLARYAVSERLSDDLQADPSLQERLTRVASALDEVTAALSVPATFVIAIDETLRATAGDTTQTLGHYLANAHEQAVAWIGFRMGDEVYSGVVMNLEGRMPISTYDGFGFNSFAQIAGRYYGANDEGIFLLEGATDDGEPIPAKLKTMLLDFDSTVMKRVQTAYVGYTSDGDLVMRVKAVTNGELREHWFKARPRTANAPREQIVNLGRGLRSRYWQFELANINGSDFEITKMDLYPVFLSRRS